jgi:hypothetical protein
MDVEKELREYLACGVLGHGFVRIWCDDCQKSIVVGFTACHRCLHCLLNRADKAEL